MALLIFCLQLVLEWWAMEEEKETEEHPWQSYLNMMQYFHSADFDLLLWLHAQTKNQKEASGTYTV